MKKFNKFVLVLSFVFALSFNMFANFGKAFAETSYKTTQDEIQQNGYINYYPFPYDIDLDLSFLDAIYYVYNCNVSLTNLEYNAFYNQFNGMSLNYPMKVTVFGDYSLGNWRDIISFDRISYDNNVLSIRVKHTYLLNGSSSHFIIDSHYLKSDLYLSIRSKLDYYLPLTLTNYNRTLLFEMSSVQPSFALVNPIRAEFIRLNSIPFTSSVATLQPSFYFYPDGYDISYLQDTFTSHFYSSEFSFYGISTTYPDLTSIIFQPVPIGSFYMSIYGDDVEKFLRKLEPFLFDSGSMEDLETDFGVPFIFRLFDFNFYPSLNEGVSNSVVSGLPDTVSCAWYDIPCHLGNALIYFMKEFPLTKPIIDFIDGAFILLSLPFELLLQLFELGGNSLFIGFIFLLVVMSIVGYFMR